ncbi:protein NRT1/ PTR FAMILY 1.1 [Sesamum angolense]|uniref:Protein NRT1/ PTR FAMILY 1.1 n=1 Tax=Sesamum angolense TaxID=2727404 RepID=A0AAE1VYY8_9LAMI|nr:protein NRT1/ PTR FAMILY 1.1 [Sesamum angolense]
MYLCTAFGLISVGAGGIRSSSLAFGADQLEKGDFKKSSGLKESYFSWYYASYMFSVLIALTCVVYIQDNMGWGVGFAVPAVLVLFGVSIFFFASRFYVKLKSKTSLLTGFIQVVVASYRNRRLDLKDGVNNVCHRKNGSGLVFPSENLRDPDKDLTADGRAVNPWSLCSVEQVEELKALLRSHEKTSSCKYQKKNGNWNSFLILGHVGISRNRSYSSIACSRRRILGSPTSYDPNVGNVAVPQNCLTGFAEASNAIAQNEFYFSEFPRSMSSIASTLNGIGMSLANLAASFIMNAVDTLSKAGGKESWISSNINKGHYDYYYLVLAALSMANMMYFLLCSSIYGPLKEEKKIAEKEDES